MLLSSRKQSNFPYIRQVQIKKNKLPLSFKSSFSSLMSSISEHTTPLHSPNLKYKKIEIKIDRIIKIIRFRFKSSYLQTIFKSMMNIFIFVILNTVLSQDDPQGAIQAPNDDRDDIYYESGDDSDDCRVSLKPANQCIMCLYTLQKM